MSPTRKTSAIVALAGAVALSAVLLHRSAPSGAATVKPVAIGALELRAGLQSSHVLAGSHETHLAVTVRGPGLDQARVRPPINLAVVLDRSGSMADGKLEDAKAAAHQLIRQLRADDRFAVVAYGTEVEVVMPSTAVSAAARQQAYAAIDRIYDDGSTNLSGGLEAARRELAAYPLARGVSRIVLISDGIANEGLSSTDDLAALARDTANAGISITTVGVGLDFDERTMTRIAVEGRGRYHFAEHTALLAELFASELESLGSTTAVDVTLALQPAAGVTVLEAYGYRPVEEGGKVLIPISDLNAGELRKVVVRLRVDAPERGAIDVATVEVGYRRTGEDRRRRERTVARAEITREHQVVLGNRDLEVNRHIERALTAQAIEQATELSAGGRFDEAEAVLEYRSQAANDVAADLGDDSFAAEIDKATGGAIGNIREAAKPGAPSKRAIKQNMADSYQLMR
jgi:Ca-activated chloride channel homolog